jgi:hypothetical protein
MNALWNDLGLADVWGGAVLMAQHPAGWVAAALIVGFTVAAVVRSRRAS